jgi:hypothetical protein
MIGAASLCQLAVSPSQDLLIRQGTLTETEGSVRLLKSK